MFIVIREWGEYSEHGSRCVCTCNTLEDANKAIELMVKVDKFSVEESKKLKVAAEEYEATLGMKNYPERPHKSTIDPNNLISQKEWLKRIDTYNKRHHEVDTHNRALRDKTMLFVKNWKYDLPQELETFRRYVSVSNWYSSCFEKQFTYDVEDVPEFVSD